MSTNPYAAPKAQVSDDTIVLRGNFIPSGRRVPTGNGWAWIAKAWSIFRASAGMWIGMVLVLFVMLVVFAFIPFIGAIANALLWLVLVAGLMVASRTIDQGGDVQFGQLFAGFKHRFGTLIAVGVINFVATLVIMLLVGVVTGVGVSAFMSASDPQAFAAMGATMVLAALLFFALLLPLMMAIWFAAPLVVFHELGAFEAMKASFIGCLKNVLPFLLYGIVLVIAAVVASVPLLLGWLVLGPVMFASVYTAYRDIYFSDSGT